MLQCVSNNIPCYIVFHCSTPSRLLKEEAAYIEKVIDLVLHLLQRLIFQYCKFYCAPISFLIIEIT